MSGYEDASCWVCGEATRPFFSVEDIPVLSCALWPSLQRAKDCVKRDIRLSFCENCGFVQNDIFDEAATEYSELYENALHFSKVYQDYSREEANRMIARLDLHNKDIIEIGSGDGHFMHQLCELGDNRGLGFDPSYSAEKNLDWGDSKIRIISEYFGEKHKDLQCDLLISRHVLEHIPGPRNFMQSIRGILGDRRETYICFEVPNAMYLLKDLSLWDVIYEHCSYFTSPSLRRLFVDTGFHVNEIRVTFMDQCLAIEAIPSSGDISLEDSSEVASIDAYVAAFATQAEARLDGCRQQLEDLAAEGKRVALWGTGARAVIYLNMVGAEAADVVKCAVDINPRKHGAFLPGTGQEVVPPERLAEYAPDVVLIMNPIYEDEITRSVKEQGITAEIMIV